MHHAARAIGFQRVAGSTIGEITRGVPLPVLALAAHLADFRTAMALVNRAEGRAGLDGKVVIHDALTFDFTFNPDFSQIESDEPQVTINQRFEVFFRERRPFFIENSGFFQTPQNLFFSRRIADPEFGSRLTGKLGRWVLGALATDDRAPGRGLVGSERRAEIGRFGPSGSSGRIRISDCWPPAASLWARSIESTPPTRGSG
jgi:hypothetical protein